MLGISQVFGKAFENSGHLLVGESGDGITEEEGAIFLTIVGLILLIGFAILHVIYWLTYPVSVWIMVYLLVDGTCNNLWSLLVPAMC